ncbi:MAG TPA: hypothetical protein PLL30_15495 [Candidatus Krumholzibacteria bacterium]|nr:hypothetical protein [Candidatus Krumholzibacteria bacterium]HPD73175.1 hypothetical protein [Candidatus Krumholzibacteria bacterium]HRY41947.1 hypothetical protein [Candidatus Krumholzibacteria bacterium]
MDHRREHLRLLAVFHFVYAGLVVLATLAPILWMLLASLWWPELADRSGGDAETRLAAAMKVMGLAFGLGALVVTWIWAGVLVVAGRCLLAPRRHTFCMVVAGIACLGVPLGTALGVCTLVILNRNDVRQLFDAPAGAA